MADSLTDSSADEIRQQSAGTDLPDSTTTMSPTTRSSELIVVVILFLITIAVETSLFR
jgi:hypothetical protein